MTRTVETWAKLDTSLNSDPKVVALARRQQDAMKTGTTMHLYTSTVLASWREDRSIPVADAAPAWMATVDISPLIGDLVAVGLVDGSGAIPDRTLDRWMEVLRDQRERARVAGILGNLAQGNVVKTSSASRDASRAPSRDASRDAYRDAERKKERKRDERTSSSTGSPHARARARSATPVGAILADMRLDDDEDGQRSH